MKKTKLAATMLTLQCEVYKNAQGKCEAALRVPSDSFVVDASGWISVILPVSNAYSTVRLCVYPRWGSKISEFIVASSPHPLYVRHSTGTSVWHSVELRNVENTDAVEWKAGDQDPACNLKIFIKRI